MSRKLTYKERRARMDAWLKNADEVLAEYAEPEEDPDDLGGDAA